MLKKILVLFLSVILSFSALIFTSCKKEDIVNIYAVDGAPVIAISNLIEKTQINDTEIKVNIVKDVEALKGAIGRVEADVAVCPINVASALYNGGVDFKLLSVNIFGVLKIVSKESKSLTDLKGETVYNIGAGGTPDVTLKYLLSANGIEYTENLTNPEKDKVNLKYVSSAEDLIPLLKTGVAKYGVLGEPAVEKASQKAEVTPIISLTDEWKKLHNLEYTQAGVSVRSKLLNDNPKFVKALYNELEKSNQYALDNAENLKDILISNGSLLQIDFNKNIISNCNLNCKSAYALKGDIEKYLSVLYDYKPQVIGGKLPDVDFYINYEKL